MLHAPRPLRHLNQARLHPGAIVRAAARSGKSPQRVGKLLWRGQGFAHAEQTAPALIMCTCACACEWQGGVYKHDGPCPSGSGNMRKASSRAHAQ